ncbi:TPA: hypothetical protein U1711_002146, partial [Streptococcus suis]|nr:hypothetical protein [Streptococcus suis]HEM5627248.1 hypothetical protein [Streptococcus suis]
FHLPTTVDKEPKNEAGQDIYDVLPSFMYSIISFYSYLYQGKLITISSHLPLEKVH